MSKISATLPKQTLQDVLDATIAVLDSVLGDNRVYAYAEQFRKSILQSKCFGMIDEIERDWRNPQRDETALRNKMVNFAKYWMRFYHREIDVPHTREDMKRLHVLKRQKRLDDRQYRDVLLRASGKSSGGTMRHFEVRLAERALLQLK